MLPDPDNPHIIQELATRFNRPADELRMLINQAKTEYLSFGELGQRKKGAHTDIWLASVSPVYTLYRFDNIAVVSLHSYKQHGGGVPHFVTAKNGSLYDFAIDEFELIVSEQPPRNIAKKITS